MTVLLDIALSFLLYVSDNPEVSGKIESNSRTIINDAFYCYYITQCCNWVATPLNDSDKLLSWANHSILRNCIDNDVEIFLDSIILSVPFAYLRHLKRISDDTLEDYISSPKQKDAAI